MHSMKIPAALEKLLLTTQPSLPHLSSKPAGASFTSSMMSMKKSSCSAYSAWKALLRGMSIFPATTRITLSCSRGVTTAVNMLQRQESEASSAQQQVRLKEEECPLVRPQHKHQVTTQIGGHLAGRSGDEVQGRWGAGVA